jgi:predicted RNase H-like HicB family nuclease
MPLDPVHHEQVLDLAKTRAKALWNAEATLQKLKVDGAQEGIVIPARQHEKSTT